MKLIAFSCFLACATAVHILPEFNAGAYLNGLDAVDQKMPQLNPDYSVLVPEPLKSQITVDDVLMDDLRKAIAEYEASVAKEKPSVLDLEAFGKAYDEFLSNSQGEEMEKPSSDVPFNVEAYNKMLKELENTVKEFLP